MAEEPSDQRPLLLLDGMSLAFRAFFALTTDIATSEGVVTNALHGFASMLHLLIRTQQPRALAVAFDLTGGTFRPVILARGNRRTSTSAATAVTIPKMKLAGNPQ